MFNKEIDNFLKEFYRIRIQGGKTYDDYFINKSGTILNCKRSTPRIMKPTKKQNGYYQIGLRDKNGDRKHYHIHRLVASTFIKNKGGKKYVNHIDGDKSNNNINNLEWVTQSENTIHAYENDLINGVLKPCKLYYKDKFVKEFDRKTNLQKYLSDKINLSKDHIRKCLNGNRNISKNSKLYGYKIQEI